MFVSTPLEGLRFIESSEPAVIIPAMPGTRFTELSFCFYLHNVSAVDGCWKRFYSPDGGKNWDLIENGVRIIRRVTVINEAILFHPLMQNEPVVEYIVHCSLSA
jgi:hypothetical protein